MPKAENYTQGFWRCALPSMFAQLLNSLFLIVDGYFIGRNMGDTGLAAINVAWPLVAFMQACSMAVGVGGAVRMSIYAGRQDMDSSRRECAQALLMLCTLSVILGLVLYALCPLLLPLLGGREGLYDTAAEYMKIVCWFSICQVMCSGLLPILRGQGHAMSAMALTVLGLVLNLWLDWLFIERYSGGAAGAALATAIAQLLSSLPCLIIILKDREQRPSREHFRPELRRMGGILKNGLSAFGLNISVSILMLMTNLQALRLGGTEAVAVYAVLSYIEGSIIPLISGVGDGVQPLLGLAWGAEEYGQVAALRKKGFALAAGTGLVCGALCLILKYQLPPIFGTSPEAAEKCTEAMWTLALAFPLAAVVRFACSYFCALGLSAQSSVLSYGEPLIAQPLFLFLLPAFTGLGGIWASYPAGLALTALAALLLLLFHMRDLKRRDAAA